MIRIAVVDNQIDCSSNKVHKVSSKGQIQTIDSFDFTEEILDYKNTTEKKIVVFNIKVHGKLGKVLIKHIRSKEARVCLLISNDEIDPMNQNRTLACADWILLNDRVNNSLVRELNQILDIGEPIDPKITDRVIRFIKHPQFKNWENTILLTNREIEIMHLITKGLMYKEIAAQLKISIQTVKNHIKKIYCKLDVTNRSQAILKFNRNI